MTKSTKIILGLVVVGLILGFLLIRAYSGKMIAPWPSYEEVHTVEKQIDENGIILAGEAGEKIVTQKRFSFKGFWTWVAAFLTLSILTFLYDDNPFYKFAEHLFVGVSAAYWMVLGFWSTLVPNLFGKLVPNFIAHIGLIEGLEGNKVEWIYILPLLLGIILLMRLSNKAGWISRWALAFIVGTTAGLNFVQYLSSDFMLQISQSFRPLIVIGSVDPIISTSPLICTISNILIFIGVFCGLIYFFFSVEHKGFFGVTSRLGIWVLMVSFGASFGFTVMGRVALLVGRLEFLFGHWLGFM